MVFHFHLGYFHQGAHWPIQSNGIGLENILGLANPRPIPEKNTNPIPSIKIRPLGLVERRSRVHVEVWAHGERLGILNRNMAVTTEFLKAPCDTFMAIGRCHNLDTQGQRAKKESVGQSSVQGGRKTSGARIMSWRQR